MHVAESLGEIAAHAPPRDVGIFMKTVGVAIFILALGAALSFIIRGSVTVSKAGKPPITAEKNPVKDQVEK